MALLLITHDLGVVAEMAHQVAVMYAGELVEKAGRQAFFAHPAHPYSQKLFAALPTRNKRGLFLEMIKGSVPPLTKEFTGCRFAERCDFAWERCYKEIPSWIEVAPNHRVRCHLYEAGTKDEGGGMGLETRSQTRHSGFSRSGLTRSLWPPAQTVLRPSSL